MVDQIFPTIVELNDFTGLISDVSNYDYSSVGPILAPFSINSDKSGGSIDMPIFRGPLTPSLEGTQDPIMNILNYFLSKIKLLTIAVISFTVFEKLIEALGSLLYSLFTILYSNFDSTQQTIAKKISLIQSISLLIQFLSPKIDKIGGISGDSANELKLGIKSGYIEIAFDCGMFLLTTMQIAIGNEIDFTLNSEGKSILATKLSYIWSQAWAIGFNFIGETLEDIAKMHSVGSNGNIQQNSDNLIANSIEFISELFRLIPNTYILANFFNNLVNNEFGFTLSAGDVAFFLGWSAYITDIAIKLFKNYYGLLDNALNHLTATYSGKDQPDWMDISKPAGHIMKNVQAIIMFVDFFGANIGYAFEG